MRFELGTIVRDKVTGFTGVADNRAEYMYGCDRYYVQPKIDKDGKIPDGAMVDAPQLEYVEDEPPVMSPPVEPAKLVEMGQVVIDPIRDAGGTVTGRSVYLNGCARVLVAPKQARNGPQKPWWVDEEQVVGKKTLSGEKKVPVKPSANRSTGGPCISSRR